MDDATFLRNFARRGRVVLLADGTAVPVPTSVMDNPARAGATFRINLISPEGTESGDRRTFKPGTIGHRELPLPLLWQWQLDDGHKTAVVVGRIDYIDRTPQGLGNARGVFDSGPWGQEAQRLVRAGMVRGISGDYSSFKAQVLEDAGDTDGVITDDKIQVDQSKLVAATIVAKPAFEGCYIEVLDDDQPLPDGVIEPSPAVTASALQREIRHHLVDRLESLEQVESELLTVAASAAVERVNQLRLAHDREAAVARVRAARNITASWRKLGHDFLSAKAKMQPRDAKGRWIEIGSLVRWRGGHERTAGIPKGGKDLGPHAPFRQGRVKSFDVKTGEYLIEPIDGSPNVQLQGKDVEVVRAVIPDSPSEAQKLAAGLDEATHKIIGDTNAKLGINAPNAPHAPAAHAPATGDTSLDLSDKPDKPTVSADQALDQAKGLKAEVSDALQTAKSPDARTKEVGLQRLSDLLGVQVEDVPAEDLTPHDNAQANQATRAEDNLLPDRETLGRQLFNNLAAPGETWKKDGEKYMRAGDKLRKVQSSRLISKKRKGFIENTYGKDSTPIPSRDERWAQTWANKRNNEGVNPIPQGEVPNPIPKDAPKPDLATHDAPATPDAPAPKPDAVKEVGGATANALRKKNVLKAIQKRSGLSNEEMADAPEPLMATEDLRELVHGEDFMSKKDSAMFNDYLDEVQVAPGGRSPEQWDSIAEFISDHEQYLNEHQKDQIGEAIAKARAESLDSPGDMTVEDLQNSVDKPDSSGHALTVPDEWATEQKVNDALKNVDLTAPSEKSSAVDPEVAHPKDVTVAEADSAKKYTVNAYGPINAYLRTGDPGSNPKYTESVVQEHVKNLDSLIARSKSKKATVLYRGASNSAFPSDLAAGDVITDKGFVSTSTDPKVSDAGFSKTHDGTHAVMELHAPAGTNMLDADQAGSQMGESEFVLPRGSSFQVTAVTTDPDGTRRIIADVMPPEAPAAPDAGPATP